MNDLSPPAAGAGRSGDDLASLRTLTLVIYILYAASAFVGITAIVAIIVNYIKRDDTRGTLYESHFRWQIRTFWFGLLWACLGALTIFIGIGFVVLAVNSIWLIYRVVRGFLNWNDGKPMPVPA
ncbi:MAG: hypothetical protein KIS83_07105 [Rubrivivax sp.]|nr:hypothetical protein [Rubrivivax sp.]MCW5610438.1 hypothetical protein [Rubrivivax sp.]